MESIGAGFVSLGQTGAVVSRSGFGVVGGSCIPSSGSVVNKNNNNNFIRSRYKRARK